MTYKQNNKCYSSLHFLLDRELDSMSEWSKNNMWCKLSFQLE